MIRLFSRLGFLNVLLFLFNGNGLGFCQEKVRLLHADSLEAIAGGEGRRLAGNVQLEHQGVRLRCQEAYQFPDRNLVKLYHQVYIQTSDQVEAWGDSLIYFGDQKLLRFSGNVHLRHKDMHLYAPVLTYSRLTGIATYTQKGRLEYRTTRLQSQYGIYYQHEDSAYFEGNVSLQDTHYTLTTKRLGYHLASDKLYFLAPTTIHFKQGQILRMESGTYLPSSHFLNAYQRVWFQDSSFLFHVDTLQFNDSLGYGSGNCSGQLWNRDTTLYIYGEKWQFQGFGDTILTTDHPYLIYTSEKDTLVLYADTFITVQRDTLAFLIAYGSGKVIHSQFQALADSLVYVKHDSVILLLRRESESSIFPVLWAGNYQLSARRVELFIKNKSLDSLSAYTEVFAIQWDSLKHYHQVKSDSGYGLFRGGEIYQIHFSPYVSALYFFSDKGKYQAGNLISAEAMDFYFERNELRRIKFSGSPKGTLIPYSQLTTFELSGFRWYKEMRPISYYLPIDRVFVDNSKKKKSDIFSR